MKLIRVERNELKYFINKAEKEVVLRRLDAGLTSDEHNKGDGGYFIRSLYFDSIDDIAFHEKLAGVENRHKYRLRIYDFGTNKVKLEIKSKFNEQIKKDVVTISKKQAIRLQNGEYEFLLDNDDPVSRRVFATFSIQKMFPVVLVEYYRTAFKYDLNNIRITIDAELKRNTANLELFQDDLPMKNVFNDNTNILEVKFNSIIPAWIKKLVEPHYFTRSAISKYTLSRLH